MTFSVPSPSSRPLLDFAGKGLLDPASKGVSEKSFAPPKTAFAPVQDGAAPVQEALCSLGPKDLLHPPLSTFGNFPFSVNVPGQQLPKGGATTRLLRRVLEIAVEKVLRRVLSEGALQWVLEGKRVLRRVLRRGSKKGLSRRPLEGRKTPFQEHDPLHVRPIYAFFFG